MSNQIHSNAQLFNDASDGINVRPDWRDEKGFIVDTPAHYRPIAPIPEDSEKLLTPKNPTWIRREYRIYNPVTEEFAPKEIVFKKTDKQELSPKTIESCEELVVQLATAHKILSIPKEEDRRDTENAQIEQLKKVINALQQQGITVEGVVLPKRVLGNVEHYKHCYKYR